MIHAAIASSAILTIEKVIQIVPPQSVGDPEINEKMIPRIKQVATDIIKV
jgi:hypothetical protein